MLCIASVLPHAKWADAHGSGGAALAPGCLAPLSRQKAITGYFFAAPIAMLRTDDGLRILGVSLMLSAMLCIACRGRFAKRKAVKLSSPLRRSHHFCEMTAASLMDLVISVLRFATPLSRLSLGVWHSRRFVETPAMPSSYSCGALIASASRLSLGVLLRKKPLVHLEGESSNVLFDVLADWNHQLQAAAVDFEELSQ